MVGAFFMGLLVGRVQSKFGVAVVGDGVKT